MKKAIMVFKIITLVLWIIIAFWAFVPVGKMTWVFSMIFYMINAIVYLILWLLMIRHTERWVDDILLLFIPVCFYTGINIATSAGTVYFCLTIAISLITVGLTILSLVKKPEADYQSIRKWPIITIAVVSVLLTVLSEYLTGKFYDIVDTKTETVDTWKLTLLKYNDIIALAVLLIVFIVFLSIERKRKKNRTL